MKPIRQLNPQQKKAATQIYGAQLVNAGPGTGKTAMLSARIMNMMLSDAQIDPNVILALTYTDAGVVAMRKRLVEYMGKDGYKVVINTFHSLCNDVIKSNPDYFGIADMDVVSEIEAIDIVKQIIDSFDDKHPLYRKKGDRYFEVKRLLNLYRIMKDENILKEDVVQHVKSYIASLPEDPDFIYKRGNSKRGIQVGDPKVELINKEVDRMEQLVAASLTIDDYNNALTEKRRYDYSDMIQFVMAAFEDSDWMKLYYQEKFQFVLVDEMQDTSGSQLKLLKLLMDFWDEANIFAVGDLDQVLFEFQGARHQNIEDYKHHFKAAITNLDRNYRSGQSILNHAFNVISNDPYQQPDQHALSASRNSKANISPLVYEFGTIFEEEAGVVDMIQEKIKAGGTELSEIAVIFRKHRHGENIMRALHNLKIPVNVKKRVNVLNEPIIRYLIACLNATNSLAILDSKNAIRVMTPIMCSRYSGLDLLDAANAIFKLRSIDSVSPVLQDQLEGDIARFWTKMIKISAFAQTAPIVKVIEMVMEEMDVLKILARFSDQYQQVAYIHTFFGLIKDSARKDFQYSIVDLMQDLDIMHENSVSLMTNTLIHDKDGVNLLTVHGSKGLEFKVVILIGCTRNEWEGSRGMNMDYKMPPGMHLNQEDKVATNRRLFYVAITRAKDELFITYSSHNNAEKELEPTQFIEEAKLPSQEVTTSDQVLHFMESITGADKFYDERARTIEANIYEEFLEHYMLSVSHMNKYLKCKVAFFYENILRVPFVPTDALIFGNAVHRALKKLYDYHRENKELMPVENFVDIFKNDLDKHRGLILDADYFRRLSLVPVLEKYYTDIVVPSNKITLNEYKVSNLVIDGIPFTGDFDKLEFDYNLVDIVDYKTGKFNYTKSQLKPATDDYVGGDYWRQLVTYKIMLDNIYWKPWKFRSARIEMIDEEYVGPLPGIPSLPGKPIGLNITPEDESRVLYQMKTVYDGIKNQDFSNGCGDPGCKWCNLR